MLHCAQIRAARGLLDWRQDDLAKAARIGIATLRRIEDGTGPAMANMSTLLRIQAALEKAGVCFINPDSNGGIGVRLVKSPDQKETKRHMARI